MIFHSEKQSIHQTFSIFNKTISFLMLMLFISLTGCGSGESNISLGNRTGILYWGNGTEPASLDPHIATGVPEHHIMSSVMEGLVLKDRKSLEPRPGVAESWTISDDGRIYTFKLRDDARWSNGDPHIANDYVWSWWRALQPALGNQYAYMLFPIKNAKRYYDRETEDFGDVGVKALDQRTLQVTLTNPTPYFLQLLDHYSLFPVHQATIEKFGNADQRGTRWSYEGNLVSNGPFKLDEWKINRHITVTRNLHYWDNDNVALNGIVFKPVENTVTEERMFRAGQLHVTSNVPADKISTYRKSNSTELKIAPYLGTYFYRLNIKTPQLQDRRVRRALGMAIDREKLVENITKGGQIPAYTMTPPGTMGYYPTSTLAFDPEGAKNLLSEAGYPNGEGFPAIEILYNTNEGHRKIAVALQEMWKDYLNIDIKLLNQEWKVYLATESAGDYQISRGGWIGDYVDPNNFLDMFLCGGGNNRTGWCNEEYDRLILEVAPSQSSHEERLAVFQQAETMLLDDMPIIPVYTYTSVKLVDSSVENLDGNIMNQAMYKDIYLSPRQ
ncbi:peptide ABC transporter substrate-binding protein [Porticoccaceae bacterium]|jgi:oligopeptide transport system substrate-binding protein|nr:peptide ABC transporter substrate-binding protein [Porticoccaceae bacterium]MBT7561200.1 peptide ABC transporter substrate-binding protein [Pseudomonadota bacterium]MDA7588944.1 peptide ABC transporter substrate-binding protein [Porticoccaceae bacterium]MDC3200733.1 peptide ABC transporter substrate-binding protein [Porticoccaceae bacterium]